MDGAEKVVFRLEPDESGWPPASAEGLWAWPLGAGRHRLDNIPFFARGVGVDDIVTAERGADGQLWVTGVAERAGHSTIRVIARDDEGIEALRSELRGLGCSSEAYRRYRLIAVDVPPGVDLAAVRALLAEGEDAGRWGYEEAHLAR